MPVRILFRLATVLNCYGYLNSEYAGKSVFDCGAANRADIFSPKNPQEFYCGFLDRGPAVTA
jgi:hypothetical protein